MKLHFSFLSSLYRVTFLNYCLLSCLYTQINLLRIIAKMPNWINERYCTLTHASSQFDNFHAIPHITQWRSYPADLFISTSRGTESASALTQQPPLRQHPNCSYMMRALCRIQIEFSRGKRGDLAHTRPLCSRPSLIHLAFYMHISCANFARELCTEPVLFFFINECSLMKLFSYIYAEANLWMKTRL